MLRRVLVADRGEVARRIMRTCRRLGIGTLAVHSDADAGQPHVAEADRAVRLGPAPPAESYLDVDRVVGAATTSGADAIHPGYGFLAESASLADACAQAGITFVGPSADVLRVLGDKVEAKRQARAADVPVVAGPDRGDLDDAALAEAATDLGLPVVLKPVVGGGGAGLRVVREAAALAGAVAAARREATAAVGDPRLLVERLLPEARHIEIQIAGDGRGGVVHLGERECSVQRRHQKLVEETPSAAVDAGLRVRMGAAAVRLATAVGYAGLGTVEFLLDASGGFHLLEVNPRLQVEHPVTEAVTGLDLVELQLRVAVGGALPVTQEEVAVRGHALEVRVYAEVPERGFLPRSGTVGRMLLPDEPDLRVDAAVEDGTAVPDHYDPLLAKLVVHTDDRDASIRRMRGVLRRSAVMGVATNLEFLDAVLATPAFAAGELTTAFVADHLEDWRPAATPRTVLVAAAAALVAHHTGRWADGLAAGADLWRRAGPWRGVGPGAWPLRLRDGDAEHELRVRRTRLPGAGLGLEVQVEDRTVPVALTAGPGVGSLRIRVDGTTLPVEALVTDGAVWVMVEGLVRRLAVVPSTRRLETGTLAAGAALRAPLPGSVVTVLVEAGDLVTAGDTLLAVEAMKMEHPVVAPAAGRVAALHVREGDAVGAGDPLVEVTPEVTDATSDRVEGTA